MFPIIPQQKQFQTQVSRRIIQKARSPYLNYKSAHLVSEFKANQLKQFIHKDRLIKQIKDKELQKAKEQSQNLKRKLKSLQNRQRRCQELNFAQKLSKIGELKHQIASFKKNKNKSRDLGQQEFKHQQSQINSLDIRIRRKLLLDRRITKMIEEKRDSLEKEDPHLKSINETDVKEHSCLISDNGNQLQLQDLKAYQQILSKKLQNLKHKQKLTDSKIVKSLRNLQIVCRFLDVDLPNHLLPQEELSLIPEQSDIIYN